MAFLLHLSEVDLRKLYLRDGFSSLFQYCTKELGLSESTTLKRIQVARAGRKFPLVFSLIEQTRLSLSNASLLAPHLTETNHEKLLLAACGKSKFNVERLVVTYFPKPEERDAIRRLPGSRAPQEPVVSGGNKVPEKTSPDEKFTTPAGGAPETPALTGVCKTPGESPTAVDPPPAPPIFPRECAGIPPASRRDRVVPLFKDRIKFVFYGDGELEAMYRTLSDRLRHKYPHARMEDVVAAHNQWKGGARPATRMASMG